MYKHKHIKIFFIIVHRLDINFFIEIIFINYFIMVYFDEYYLELFCEFIIIFILRKRDS